MRKLALIVATMAAFMLPVAADAAPDHQHGGAHSQRIDWD